MFIIVNKLFEYPVFDENGDKVRNDKGETVIESIKTSPESIDIQDIKNFRPWRLTKEEKKHLKDSDEIISITIKDEVGGTKRIKILEPFNKFNNRLNEMKARMYQPNVDIKRAKDGEIN